MRSWSDEDDDAIANEEEEERGAGAGAGATRLLRRAQSALNEAGALLGDAEDCVAQYGRQYRFSQARYDEASRRLRALERLVREHGARSVEELLTMADQQVGGCVCVCILYVPLPFFEAAAGGRLLVEAASS
jgi:DNA repair ATPase RecN